MSYFIIVLLILSLVGNGILIWFSRKLTKKIWDCMFGVDEFQKYLEGYAVNLKSVAELSDYYGDQTIKGVIEDTDLVIGNCKLFKTTILGEDAEEKLENETEQ